MHKDSFSNMLLGVDYYPEQWDYSLLNEDLDNIKELGCNVIRIGEFSWHLLEPKEGKYDFSFFDEVISNAKKRDLKIIMGTPTATIPAWLAKKHISILSEYDKGHKISFGGRHVYCFNSHILYEYSEKIIRKLVDHYKDEKSIIAWQVDNEIGHEGSDECFCDNCQKQFRLFLKNKFNSNIEKLNYVYGTAFWSQIYNDFDEIPMPLKTITTHNPALRLDWERFRSESIEKYIAFQAKLIKEICPNAIVMHDFSGGGLTKHVDFSKVASHIDVVAYNNYPVWGGQKEPIKPYEIAFNLDYIRGLKGKLFWISEAIMGAQGHDITGFLPRPNQAKMWSYQAFARGCNGLMFFRYRGAIKGAEQFCYGIIDADNCKGRKFDEVKSFFEDIRKYGKDLNQDIDNKVAILYDYDSLASFRIQRQSKLLNVEEEMKSYYKVFYEQNIGVDVISIDKDISKYKIVIMPHLIITKDEIEKKINAFVKNGGTLIMTYRCAVKDKDNNLVFQKTLPINYSDLTGINVVEVESLQEKEIVPIKGKGKYSKIMGTCGVFRELIKTIDAQVLFKYEDVFYSSFAAVTMKKHDKGIVYYIGSSLQEDILEKLLKDIIKNCKIKTIKSPKGIEIVKRGTKTMYINHNQEEKEVENILLAPFECKIL